jgi:hypothetical protein
MRCPGAFVPDAGPALEAAIGLMESDMRRRAFDRRPFGKALEILTSQVAFIARRDYSQ